MLETHRRSPSERSGGIAFSRDAESSERSAPLRRLRVAAKLPFQFTRNATRRATFFPYPDLILCGISMSQIDIAGVAGRIIANIEKVIIGKRPQLTLAVSAYFCEGHILLEDVPGVAKTMLARALARSVGSAFKRIQCTPDLLPTDVTGVSIFNQKTAEFEFRAGPLFAQTVLADEINRTTPRTQAALLEAMAERRITVDGQTYVLKPPFLVIATPNPIDQEGTFPLPEAQLDRFLVRLSLGYPGPEEESKMLQRLQ